jgi:hypothetical protein
VLLLLKLVLSAVVAAIAIGISDTLAGYAVADLLTNVLIAPLSAIAAAVMYFEILRLREGAAAPAPAPAGPEVPTQL